MLLLPLGFCLGNAYGLDPSRSESETEFSLQQGREAYRQGRYDASLRFALEVVLKDPSHPQARELLRLAARTAAASEKSQIQQERSELRRQAEDSREMDRVWVIPHGRWSEKLEERLEEDDLLEAYDWLYAILEQNPDDAWVQAQIHGRMTQRVAWKHSRFTWRPNWYQEAVWGFYYYSQEDMDQAKKHWSGALAAASKISSIPEKRIRRYLQRIEGGQGSSNRKAKP